MIRILAALIVATGLVAGHTAALAHSDHAPLEPYDAQVLATNYATRLVQVDVGLGFGKLPASWANLTSMATTVVLDTPEHYVIAVHNAAENKTLYFLMSRGGDVYGINFTGEFDEVR
ncbi:hypothetical protein ATO13_22521 [Stappia sp. 22II-S9-Z10]|nr:hypothetical protein ATO13_22521 [Stappia sp. 22II-S9-Z10]